MIGGGGQRRVAPFVIHVTHQGEIVSSTLPLGEGLGVADTPTHGIDPENLRVCALDKDPATLTDREGFLLHSHALRWRASEGRLCFMAPDFTGACDLFSARLREGGILLSNDFWTLVEEIPEFHLDEAAVGYFMRHGGFRADWTWIREVRRVPAGMRLLFHDQGPPEVRSIFEDLLPVIPAPRTYKGFLDVLDSVFETEVAQPRDVILLSGGWDSALIALELSARASSAPAAATFSYDPTSASNARDVEISRRIADHLGLDHQTICLDFHDARVDTLLPLVMATPLAAHFSFNFLQGCQALAEAGRSGAWCGQNADAVYNLGPTSRLGRAQGKIDLIKRYFLSRAFLETLPDIENGGGWWPMRKGLSAGGLLLARRFYKDQNLRRPESFAELLSCFAQAEDYMALAHTTRAPETGKAELVASPISTREARCRLFHEKMNSYLVGGDARVARRGPEFYGMCARMPFAAPSIVLFFREHEMTWRDVWTPKRYFKRRLIDGFGDDAMSTIFAASGVRSGPDSRAWREAIIRDLPVGRELSERAASLPPRWRQARVRDPLQALISRYWFHTVTHELGRMGTLHI